MINAIAIDYDDTFTSAPETWSEVIRLLQKNGNLVICATARSYSEQAMFELLAIFPVGVRIVFCGNSFKRPACEKAGYNVTIWIDDQPSGIEKSSGIIWVERLKSFIHSTKDWIKRQLKYERN